MFSENWLILARHSCLRKSWSVVRDGNTLEVGDQLKKTIWDKGINGDIWNIGYKGDLEDMGDKYGRSDKEDKWCEEDNISKLFELFLKLSL